MLVTEEEAKKKWCPMVSFHVGFKSNVFDNKPGGSPAHNGSCFCIASDCMKWRWRESIWAGKETLGYCGLGGKVV
jgi:hypothetical protein